MALTLKQLADAIGATVHGDESRTISAVSTLQNAGPGEIAFFANRHYKKHLANSAAGAVVLTAADLPDCPVDSLVIDNPYLGFAKIAALLNPPARPEGGIHASAVVEASADIGEGAQISAQTYIGNNVKLGRNAVIGPGCVIGDECEVGAGTRLQANVTLYPGVVIGQRGLIHSGAVLGSDGFGIAQDGERWVKVPQLGGVAVGDDVEIGANTTVDRGALEDTRIGNGAKLDNLIQIAHNVVIGEHTAIAACVGIAGSARIGRCCAIGGGVGILGHLEVADHVQITAMSLVTKSIRQPGVYSSGTPLQDNKHWHRNFVRFKQLDDMAQRIAQLERHAGTKKDAGAT